MRAFILLLTLCITSPLAAAMSFSLQERCYSELTPRCQTMVLAEGSIDRNTATEFKTFSQTLPAGTWIALTSPGGSLVGGMQLGSVIRERGFHTTIGQSDHSANSCLSACAYAFLGGLQRLIPEGARYGLHQFRARDQELNAADTQKLSAILAKYVDRMGVDRRLLDIAQLTATDRVTLLSPAQAKLYRVDNFGQSPLPRWRLDAADDGKVIAFNTSQAADGKLPVVLAFVSSNQTLVALVYYRASDARAFTSIPEHRLVIANQSYALQPRGEWQAKTNGYQARFIVPPAAQAALSTLAQTQATALFELQADFDPSVRPATNTNLENASPNPNATARITARFGVAGLSNALQALR